MCALKSPKTTTNVCGGRESIQPSKYINIIKDVNRFKKILSLTDLTDNLQQNGH